MKYLLRYWRVLPGKARAKYKVLFLDFDGTLAKIVKSPRKARIEPSIKLLLLRITQDKAYRVAVISGRALGDIKKRVGIKGIVYIGNHGLEIDGSKIRFSGFQIDKFRLTLKRLKAKLKQRLDPIKGIFIEDKGLSLSVHYRLVKKKDLAFFKAAFAQITAEYASGNKIKIHPGKKVFEIRPPLQWDKGKVALWLLARWKSAFADKEVLTVYIGDDLTDEDAFRALAGKAITAVVGKRKDSAAAYYLNNVGEVARFLNVLGPAKCLKL